MSSGFTDYYGGLAIPLPVLQGGTGETSFPVDAVLYSRDATTLAPTNVGDPGDVLAIPASGGAPQFGTIGAAVDLTNQQAPVAATTLVASAAARVYRIGAALYLENPLAGSIAVSVSITWTQHGSPFTMDVASVSQSNGANNGSGTLLIYPDAGTAIKYACGFTGSAGQGQFYDAHIRLEKMS